MKLVWDVNDWQLKLGELSIVVSPEQFPPFPVSAIVEEQDTGLILGKPEEITQPTQHTTKRLITEMLNVKPITPGSVVVRQSQPIRFCAVIHDLECDPTWREQWIARALEEVFHLIRKKGIVSISLPLLGTVHGRYDYKLFLKQLFPLLEKESKVSGSGNEPYLQRLWLIVPPDRCPEVLQLLKSLYVYNS